MWVREDEEVGVVSGDGGLDDVAAAAAVGAEESAGDQAGCCGDDGCMVTADAGDVGTPQTESPGVPGWCVPVPGGFDGAPAVDTSFPQPVDTGEAQHVDTGPAQPVDTGVPSAPVETGGAASVDTGSAPADGGSSVDSGGF